MLQTRFLLNVSGLWRGSACCKPDLGARDLHAWDKLLSAVANTGAAFLGSGVSADKSMHVLDLAAVDSVIGRCCMRSPEPNLCAVWGFVLHHCRCWSHNGLFCRLDLGKAAISFAAWLPLWEGCSLQRATWCQGVAFGSGILCHGLLSADTVVVSVGCPFCRSGFC